MIRNIHVARFGQVDGEDRRRDARLTGNPKNDLNYCCDHTGFTVGIYELNNKLLFYELQQLLNNLFYGVMVCKFRRE